MTTQKLKEKFLAMFDCDEVRISQPGGEDGLLFLLIGNKRHTKDDHDGYWVDQDGRVKYFEYIDWKVIAHGVDEKALIADARKYKKILEKEEKNKNTRLFMPF